MATDHFEVQDFPRGTISLNANQRIRRLRCAWSDIDALFNELFLSAYPYDTSGVVATRFSFKPWDKSRQSLSASPTASYDDAEVTVVYDSNVGGASLVSEVWRPFSIKQRAWHWALAWENNIGASVPESDAPIAMETGLSLTVTYYRVTTIPPTAITQMGLINSLPVITPVTGLVFPTHTLFYEGPGQSHTVLNTGVTGSTLAYNFKAVYREKGGIPLGWNGHWRSEKGEWQTIFERGGNQVKRPEGNIAF
jgi:hypothetical protein